MAGDPLEQKKPLHLPLLSVLPFIVWMDLITE
uniref:Uncharacterized protein n=1 Tax=Anguilla anguilla TaxID=7936 RepID=A0A0E9VBN4_ANGAN